MCNGILRRRFIRRKVMAKGYMHKNVYCTFVYNGKKLKQNFSLIL
jgi:hypothetical protein